MGVLCFNVLYIPVSQMSDNRKALLSLLRINMGSLHLQAQGALLNNQFKGQHLLLALFDIIV